MSNSTARVLSVIIPCFNEEESIRHTHDRLKRALAGQGSGLVELIYVDDGSVDRTQMILQELFRQEQDGRFGVVVTTVELSRNFGHSAAVLAGLEKARGDRIAIIDADLQDPPEALPLMLAKLGEGDGCDVVYGQRLQRKSESVFKRGTAWMFYRALNLLTGIAIPKDTGDFRVITRAVRDAVLRCRESDPFIRGIVAWVGYRQQPYPYVREARLYGESKYPLRKMLRFAGIAILSFSSKPLRIGIYVGMLGLVMTAIILAWSLWAWLGGNTVPGWTSLLAAFLAGQSFILMLLGVIGAYLGRVYVEVQDRPRYLVRSELQSSVVLES